MYIYIYICMYVYICTHTHICIYICTCIYIYVCVYVCICACIHRVTSTRICAVAMDMRPRKVIYILIDVHMQCECMPCDTEDLDMWI